MLCWYVAYGSNVVAERLQAYLEGATEDCRFGAHRGCADPTPPRADRWITLDRAVRFRGRSRRWGGGVAFLDLDPTPGVVTPARAWLIGLDQMADLAAQEGRLDVAPTGLADIPPGGTLDIGGGWYDTVLRLPDIEGRPALTITTGQPLPETTPTEAYLRVAAAVDEGVARADRVDQGQQRAAGAAPGDRLVPHRRARPDAGEGEPGDGDIGGGAEQQTPLG
jgi:hypothetical protein